jgi:hypothetical protein
MRVQKVSSQVAWSEREAKLRSAKRSAAALVATLAALFVLSASKVLAGQEPAIGEDWTRWTSTECEAILNAPDLAMPGWSWAPSAFQLVQLRSAIPVREALLRQMRLKNNYDAMDSGQKLAFDELNPPPLATENEPILLYVESDGTYYCSVAGTPSQLRTCTDLNGVPRYPLYSPPLRAREVALQLADGTLVMPIRTEAIQDDTEKKKFQYSFPRLVDGKPVLTMNDKALNFVFGQELTGGGRIRPLQNPTKFRVGSGPGATLKRFSFPITGLIYNGKLEY